MATAARDRLTLVAAGSWRATPDNYSSLRFLCFNEGGTGELTYAYGQTIYAVVPCKWEVSRGGRLKLIYLAPERGRLAAAFILGDGNRVKMIDYVLTEGRVTGVQDVVPHPYEFDRTLELSESPWPSGLDLPHEAPREFYGRVSTAREADA